MPRSHWAIILVAMVLIPSGLWADDLPSWVSTPEAQPAAHASGVEAQPASPDPASEDLPSSDDLASPFEVMPNPISTNGGAAHNALSDATILNQVETAAGGDAAVVPPAPDGDNPLPSLPIQPATPDDVFDTVYYETPDWLAPALESGIHNGILRFGWWGVTDSGAGNKVGEFQDLDSSPFYDIDGIFSDGRNTVDFWGSGLDQEANNARLRFYSPNVSARVDYNRFIRRLDHDPLYGTPITGPILADDNVITEDLNLGQDYAIRVQTLKASVKGQLTDHIDWRVNYWEMRKTGERQANATGHCFDLDPAPGSQTNKCHVLSQRQQIDWTTTEVEPVVRARYDDFTIEYARTMRTFGQGDDLVTRTYTRFNYSPASGTGGNPFVYAFVPETETDIDRLKVTSQLSDNNELYAYLFDGQTRNNYRKTERNFRGFDARVTNTTFDSLTLTGYANMIKEANDYPQFFVDDESALTVNHPLSYARNRFGLKSRWRPFYESDIFVTDFDPWRNLSITSGYEYYTLERDYATYSSARLGTFSQPDTKRHEVQLGLAMPWTSTLDQYIRYKGRFTEDPLIGVRESTGRFNTNQPEQEHGVDIGGTWNPRKDFMATAQFSLVNRWNYSTYPTLAPSNAPIHWSEDDYPIVTTIWYAPTDKLSLTGGYSYFSNWIDQDITIGFRGDPIETSTWDYGGQSHVVSANANYAYSQRVRLNGGIEWNWGRNSFSVPASFTGADWTQLPSFSDVNVVTTRYTAGIDYIFSDYSTLYFRYNFFDYEEKVADIDSGTAHFFLAGVSMTY